jgi:ribose transport system permease protein
VILAIVAMAQTLVVLTSGIDLSVGMVMVLANCLASQIGWQRGCPRRSACSRCWQSGHCAAINAMIVIFGSCSRSDHHRDRAQSTTAAALALRPFPAATSTATLADAATGTGRRDRAVESRPARCAGGAGVVAVPALGRRPRVYAVGSSELAAYMSGVPVRRAKFVAYTLSGLLSSVAGLFVTFVTYSGEASAASGGTYTLYSIAAVVLGGVSLFGGSGSAIGAIFGALMFRTIGDLLFVFNVEPLWQPLFQGVVLMAAVSLGRCGFCAFATVSSCMADARTSIASRRVDPAVAWAFGCVVLVLLLGSLYSRSFLSPEYLLQQLKVAAFLASSPPAR